MAPSVGRIVHYFPGPGPDDESARANNAKVIPALIVAVHNKNLVNLTVFPDFPGGALSRTSVPRTGSEPGYPGGTWEWPPRAEDPAT